MNRSLRALSSRSYLFVWMGSFLSNVGNWMENVGQGWVVASQTHSPFLVELLSFAQFIPVIFLALPAGIIADRFNRKKVLLTAQFSMLLIAATLAFLAHKGWATPKLIIMLTFFEGAAWALNAPSWQTVIPYLVPRADLESAIALNSIQYNLARLVGPAIAGYVVHKLGVAYAFDLNALSFIAVICAISWIDYGKTPHTPKPTSAQFRDAIAWVRNHPGAKRIIISMATLAILSAPLQGLMPFFASDVFNSGANGLGYLLASLGAGAVTGAFLLGQLPLYYPRHHLIPLSMFFLGLFQLLFAQAPNASFSYPTLYIAGIFWLWTLVSSNTAMQLLVPDHIRGRAMSILLIAHVGMLPTGHMLGGLFSKWVGPRSTLSMASVGLVIAGLITLVKRVPEIDGLDIPSKRIRLRTFFSEVILASSHRAEALSLDRSSEKITADR